MAYHSYPYFAGIKEEDNAIRYEDARRFLSPPTMINHSLFQAAFTTGNSSNGNSSDSTPSSSTPTTNNQTTKARRRNYANESPEARARRLAKNAQRMREKRANESFEEYKLRLAKNAEANRRKRQNENESPEKRAIRRQKNAERNRRRRANLDDFRVKLEKSKNRLRQRVKREIARMMRTREKRDDFLKETFQEIANIFSEKDYNAFHQQILDTIYLIGIT